MRIFVKVFNNYYPDRNTVIPTFITLDHTTRLKHQKDTRQSNLLQTILYLFNNEFKLSINPYIEPYIDKSYIPDKCKLDFQLLEFYNHEWEFYSLDKRSDEKMLHNYVVKTIFDCTMEEWNSFLPILSEIETTHILHCNVFIYINRYVETNIETGVETPKLNIDVEHFIDFKKKPYTKDYKNSSAFEEHYFLHLKEVLLFLQKNFYSRFKRFF